MTALPLKPLTAKEIWDREEQRYQDYVNTGGKRDARILIGGLLAIVIILLASSVFAEGNHSREESAGGSYDGRSGSNLNRGLVRMPTEEVPFYDRWGNYIGNYINQAPWGYHLENGQAVPSYTKPAPAPAPRMAVGAALMGYNGGCGCSGSSSNGYGYGGGPRGY